MGYDSEWLGWWGGWMDDSAKPRVIEDNRYRCHSLRWYNSNTLLVSHKITDINVVSQNIYKMVLPYLNDTDTETKYHHML